MKNTLKLLVAMPVLFLLFFSPQLNAEQELFFPDPEALITMDLQGASLKDILKIFSIQSGLNFIASESMSDKRITLYLDKVPVKDAMDKLFKANNLSFELDKDSNIFIVKDWGAEEREKITKVFYLKNVPVSSSNINNEIKKIGGVSLGEIKSVVKDILTLEGKINEEPASNSLIITDIPSRFPAIEQLIKKLDLPIRQVLLNLEVLDVTKDNVDKIGFDFGSANGGLGRPFTINLPEGLGNKKETGSDINAYIGPANLRGAEGALTYGKSFSQLLDFLKSQRDTKYLARPRILTLDNQSAEIDVTVDEIVGTKDTTVITETGFGTTTREYIRATELKLTPEGTGISLRVTPHINPDTDEITLVIVPKASTTSPSVIDPDQSDSQLRTTKSVIKVKNGQTVVLGGLIHSEIQVTVNKVPVFGDIPIIGGLFRHKDKRKDVERELLIFITPQIVKDSITNKAETKKSIFSEREQNSFSQNYRQKSINTNLNTFEKIRR